MRRAVSVLATLAVALTLAAACQRTSAPGASTSGPTSSAASVNGHSGTASTVNQPITTPTATSQPIGTGSSGAGALPDPCSLLSTADLQAVVGALPGPAQHLSVPVPGGFELRLCQWSDNHGTEISVGVTNAMPFFQLAQKSAAPPIAGVGDEAIPSKDGHKLVVRRGSLIVVVEGQSASHGYLGQSQQVDLARRAVSHL